ncbi:MAG TPA: alanine--tRNA ligase [Alphaproteobacteria bacterium]|nr:alanine--tRNA ligase [Alphaproteobacteria bacterium]HNS44810.1 alanine--tRNA ligase [Alphaproteobacteria bacterium]
MITSNDVRAAFLDYFVKNGHTAVASSSLVPLNDPTLLFTNSGMVQFKNVFTGLEERPYARACSSQKCVRAGGKHNDLDNVGYTARHHTFFEMLGNFSFGDYFKEDAIPFAWNLLTKTLDIDPKRLTVTIYHDDDQAYDIWKKVAGLPDDKIIRIATDDNFWRMGDTGPCGPCSEIFYDHGAHISGGPPGSPDQDGDRFVEIWNLVFMQFEQRSASELLPLPKPSIDTGSGMERLTAVLQGKTDNFDTDIMRALILASAEASGVEPDGDFKFSHRVIADHLRASAFLIADGVVPSNEGRGYVLRRIMRRAMRHAHLLGSKDLHMHKLVPTLVQKMGDHFSELKTSQSNIVETLKIEETRFKRTLETGLRLLEEETSKLGEGQSLAGEVAFKLYDTYGFPLDLTQAALMEKNMGVDTAGFDAAMNEQRKKARQSWVGSGDQSTEAAWFPLQEKLGATEFLGYSSDTSEGQVTALLDKTGKEMESAKAGDDVLVVFNQTPFYAESGGQAGDKGILHNDGCTVEVLDTQKKLDSLFVHIGKVTKGSFKVGDVFVMEINGEEREANRRAHTAAHLFHAAIRYQLGEHVTQRGQLVTPDRFRFDVNFPKAIDNDNIREIERAVNDRICENLNVITRVMSQETAIEQGAMALFGEKYGDEVRVVAIGNGDIKDGYSVELCGGTHARHTGDIGLFKIVAESAVAANIRRIEALTGHAALEHLNDKERILNEICGMLSTNPKELPERLSKLMKEGQDATAENAKLRLQMALGGGGKQESDDIVEANNVRYIARVVENMAPKELRSLADEFKKRLKSGIVVLVGINDGKAFLTVTMTDDVSERFDAVSLANAGSVVLGGTGGGGRRTMAQAGGPNAEKANDALKAIETEIQKIA